MGLDRRDFLQVLGAASAAGLPLGRFAQADVAVAQRGLYDLPPFGNVTLLHMTDCHAQLLPVHFREPSINLGVGPMQGRLPHRVGESLLEATGMQGRSDDSLVYTHLDFEQAARRCGKVGGFAHLATLIKQLKASRPGALLLDGGDAWQGSATSLWTNAQDMVDACKLLGVDVMTGHWEFTYGMDRVRQIVEHDLHGHIDFVAQNVTTLDFDDPVFDPFVFRVVNGIRVAIIGQAFPYTPIANPRHLVADWTFGIQEARLQKFVDRARAQGARAVVLLSHNGMDVDLKLASRVRGIDVILGGHTHDAVPRALPVSNGVGKTLVTNAGSHGKYLGVMDLEVRQAGVVDFRYRLLPVFSNQIEPDADMAALIHRVRRPYLDRLEQQLAITDGLLYRRGNFNGSWDQLVCTALMDVLDTQIAMSPGFRWGTTLLPGAAITRESMMDQLAITYPAVRASELTGADIKLRLEDAADNLFNPDPYYQQGGDMLRLAGMTYTCQPAQSMGSRISDMRLKGEPMQADRRYKVASWASVAEEVESARDHPPVWQVVEDWLLSQAGGHVPPLCVNRPRLVGVQGNVGMDADDADTTCASPLAR